MTDPLNISAARVFDAAIKGIEIYGWNGSDGLQRIVDFQVASECRHHRGFHALQHRVWHTLHEAAFGSSQLEMTEHAGFEMNVAKVRQWERTVDRDAVLSVLNSASRIARS